MLDELVPFSHKGRIDPLKPAIMFPQAKKWELNPSFNVRESWKTVACKLRPH